MNMSMKMIEYICYEDGGAHHVQAFIRGRKGRLRPQIRFIFVSFYYNNRLCLIFVLFCVVCFFCFIKYQFVVHCNENFELEKVIFVYCLGI